ncbi:hypothetical protein Tsubulata_028234, partial [Turnera subulata]
HFNYVMQQVSSRKQLTTLEILERVRSPSGNSLLHVAAGSGCKDITELLCTQAPVLIKRGNFQGDTSLHSAVRAGMLETTKILLHYNSSRSNACTEEENHLVRIKNEMGNTALHDAVMKHNNDLVQCLVSADPGVSYYSNKAGKSPLYLVVEDRDAEALTLLCQAIHNKGDIPTKAEGSLSHLVSKKNQEGHYPIHVACKKGHLTVVRRFIENWWDDASEYLTKKGQNILHVAAEYGKLNIVRYVLTKPKLAPLIGGRDQNGNTALHLAARFCNAPTAFALVLDKRVDAMCVNNANLTAFEVVKALFDKLEEKYLEQPEKAEIERIKNDSTQFELRDLKGEDIASLHHKELAAIEKALENGLACMKTLSVLFFFSARRASKEKFLKRQARKPLEREEMKNRINTLLVVAVLVAGVTFAGAIQYPAIDDSKSNQVLKLRIYIYLNLFSFTLSILAAGSLTIARLNDFKVYVLVKVTFPSMGYSLCCMGAAVFLAADIAAEKHQVALPIRLMLE